MIFDIQTTLGAMTLELNTEKAPETSKNFAQYVADGFYNGTIFHRVIPNFMIQGGGFEPGMGEKTTRDNINNEANNGLTNDYGTIAMARTNEPHSASSQFFLNVKDNDFLNFQNESVQGWGYCVFGKLIESTDVLDKIAGVPTGNSGHHGDVPVEDIMIETITLHVEDNDSNSDEAESE